MQKREVKILVANTPEALESKIEEKMKEGFVFYPDSYRVGVKNTGEIMEFSILMFRSQEAVQAMIKRK